MDFLSKKYVRVLTIVLLLQASVFYAVALRREKAPAIGPLASFPPSVSGWQMVKDLPIEPEILEILKADDVLSRIYVRDSRTPEVYFYIAYFKSQRYGQAPHSPKNCLPGSGWQPVESGTIDISVPGWPTPIRSNRYVVEHGDQREVTLYWYQSHKRIIAAEFAAKFWLVADSIRYNRSDSSIVRVMVPVRNGNSVEATGVAVEFVQAVFPSVLRQLPE